MFDWAKIWDENSYNFTLEERLKQNENWDIYFSDRAENTKDSLSFNNDEVVEHLLYENILQNSESVLDMGSAFGKYSVPFSKYVNNVFAVDLSKTSLDILDDFASKNGIKNITTICKPWELFNPDRKFDLVFSSMCPAMCTRQDILRLESMSNKYCCLVTACKTFYTGNRKLLNELITDTEIKAFHSDCSFVFNYMYEQNKFPDVKMISTKVQNKLTIDQAKKAYKDHFHNFGFDDKKTIDIIDKFVEENAVDGIVTDNRVFNKAVITWKVK